MIGRGVFIYIIMKNIFIILLLFIVSSCDLIDAIDGCENPEPMELTENDKNWIPKDSVQYFAIYQDTFSIKIGLSEPLHDHQNIIDCAKPVIYRTSLATKYIPNSNLAVYANLYKSKKETNISYTFSKSTPNNLAVGTNQMMGMIDLDTNLPVPMDDSYFVHSEYLGNHTIRGREYTEVYKFTDLDESNVPEIDVASIIVSPIGFLRIEFYSGEVWERIIIE